MVKLYVDEEGHEAVRTVDVIAVSDLARVEVPSALWRKHRLAEIDDDVIAILLAGFENDYFGTLESAPRFRVVQVSDLVLANAAGLTGTAKLRAYDAVQLASAEAVRAADPGCDTFACFDASLRDAAAGAGFALYPGAQ